jgi:plasmid stabilization system protein ParE
MASKPLQFHPEAEEEYLASLSWYRERSPMAAANFESAVEDALEKSEEHPSVGHSTSMTFESLF